MESDQITNLILQSISIVENILRDPVYSGNIKELESLKNRLEELQRIIEVENTSKGVNAKKATLDIIDLVAKILSIKELFDHFL